RTRRRAVPVAPVAEDEVRTLRAVAVAREDRDRLVAVLRVLHDPPRRERPRRAEVLVLAERPDLADPDPVRREAGRDADHARPARVRPRRLAKALLHADERVVLEPGPREEVD